MDGMPLYGIMSIVFIGAQLPDIPKGMYVYGIADYGNIIAVVSDSKDAEFLW